MSDFLHYAYIDETGSVAISRHSHFLIVIALCTENPQSISRIVRRAQKKYGISHTFGEFKAKKPMNAQSLIC